MSASVQTSESSAEMRLDTSTIASLQELMGPEKFSQLIAMFYSNADKYIDGMARWQSVDNYDDLKFNVHSLKGSAANIGATKLAADCLALETLVKGRADTETLQGEIARVKLEYAHTRQALDTLLK